jgi:hypothetical protein
MSWQDKGSFGGVRGPQGEEGVVGDRGTRWFNGTGNPPTNLPDLKPSDWYWDQTTDDIWVYKPNG